MHGRRLRMRSRLIGFFICVLNLTTGVQYSSAQNENPFSGFVPPVVVWVQQKGTGPAYYVDEKDVTADPLRGIADAYERHRGAQAHYPVVAIIDDRLPLGILDEVRGLIGKVG